MRWVIGIGLFLLLVDSFYLSQRWPDWKALAQGPVPQSNVMREYRRERRQDRNLPPMLWRPVPLSGIAQNVGRAVILAEDSRFYQHSGFDLIAFKEAMDHNMDVGRIRFGASTISQQTAKNLFLSNARTPLRKWHELILTFAMEQNLSKARILHLYLNIAEFGLGVYGVEAAARYYWNKPASALSWWQAIELAATLPSPRQNNPQTRTQAFLRRTQKIAEFMRAYKDSRLGAR